LETFRRVLPKCIASGSVSKEDADFILHGISKGFDLGVDESLMGQAQVRKNYKSALQNSQLIPSLSRRRVNRVWRIAEPRWVSFVCFLFLFCGRVGCYSV